MTLIDATPGKPAEVSTVTLTAGRRLRTLRGTLDDLEAQKGTTDDAYLRIGVRGERRAGLADQVREWFPHAVDVAVESPADDGQLTAQTRGLHRSPHELFAEYLTERGAKDERVLALFSELLDSATADAGSGA